MASLSVSTVAQNGVNIGLQNPLQIATLHWYNANLTTTFGIPSANYLAFDGEHMWVTSSPGPGNVSKLRVSDGALLGTFSTGGNFPADVAFDGANTWVVNSQSNNVGKLRASDGALLGTFNVGTNPEGVAFDGANIWVANFFSNNVTKLRAIDGAVLGTFPVGAVPQGVAFDGAHIWVASSGSSTVSKL